MHIIYVAVGFPPAAKSSSYRLRATANLLADRGCDVTVVTIHDEAWMREFGLDRSLLNGLSPRIEYMKVPVSREDLNPDITDYGWFRARHPQQWLAGYRWHDRRQFPEQVFGRWRRQLEDAVEAVYRRKPADLLLVTSTPYTSLAAAWRLWRTHGVPYAIDYRDGWSVDVVGGTPAFSGWSRKGRWESKLVGSATRVWCVNQKIRDFYAARYPRSADRIRVVRNGWDQLPGLGGRSGRSGHGGPLTFGYVGTGTYPVEYTAALLEGWRLARQRDPLVAEASLVFRGYFGLAAGGAVNSHRRRIAGFARESVRYEGPAQRAELPKLYGSWDALVFAITGGPYMTSGKIYEYMATGLPILSVHEHDHGASEVLDGYPLWTPPPLELTPESLADSFVATARMAVHASDTQREKALAHAAQYERSAVMSDAIDDLLAGERVVR